MSTAEERPGIDELAAQWVVRLDGRALDPDQQQVLDRWLDDDVRHYGAFMRARAIYLRVDELRRLHGLPTTPAPVLAPAPVRNWSRRQVLWLGGGAVAASAAGAGLLLLGGAREYSTRTGEVRRVPLPDGSAMTLNTQTRLQLNFTELVREVRVVAGEALFEVAVDPTRLFLVDSFGTRVTAAAAAFTVSALRDNDVQVIVRSGQVQVSQPARGNPAVMMPANTQLRPAAVQTALASAPQPERLEAVEVERRLAWQRGELAFEDVPLEQALQQFARYSDTRVVLDSPDIGSLKVVGLFSASDPVGFARTVAVSLGLRLDIRDGVAHLAGA